MSFEVPEAHVQAYSNGVEHLYQKEGTLLRSQVTVRTGITGFRDSFEYVGKVTAQKAGSRHSDTPLISTPHVRRYVDLNDYELSDIMDKNDSTRMLIDPTNKYTQVQGFGLGNAIDLDILAAANGTAIIGTGADGISTTTAAFPAAQNFAATGSGGTAVTLADLLTARQKLRAAYAIKPGDKVTFVGSSQTITDLLSTSQIQSIDQNTVRALVGGEISGTFMGFEFVSMEDVAGLGTANEKCYIFPQSAITLSIGAEPTHMVGPDPGKRWSTRIFSSITFGATRNQEDGVVTITVDHS